jgi:hypothetical protein
MIWIHNKPFVIKLKKCTKMCSFLAPGPGFRIRIRVRIHKVIESGYNPDPDPQTWTKVPKIFMWYNDFY